MSKGLIDILILIDFNRFDGEVYYYVIHRNLVPEINCDEIRNSIGSLAGFRYFR